MKRQGVLILISFIFLNVSYGQKTIITGNIKNLAAKSIKCNFIPNSVLEKPTAITIQVTEGKFMQELSITRTTFLSLEEGGNYYGGFIQPGDSITISYDAASFKSTLSFFGKGREKFILTDSIMQLRTAFTDESVKAKNQPFPIDYLFNKIDSLQNKLTRLLISYKSLMNTESFNSFNSLIKANVLKAKYNGALSVFGDAYDEILKKQQSRLTPASKKAIQNLLEFDDNFSNSYFYTTTVASIYSVYFDDNVKPKIGDNVQAKYDYLNKQLPSKLKSSVLLLFLEREIRQNKSAPIESIIEQSFTLSKDSTYKVFLTQKLSDARALKNNMPAPDFSMENRNGEKIHLSNFKGKVIYLDFWFAACTPCHKLFKDINPVKEQFKSDSSVVFLTVSIDNRDVWEKALAKFNLLGYHAFTENKFRDHAIIRSYNVNEYPTTYLIDKEGKIFSITPSHKPDELRKEIEAALMIESK